MKIRILFAALVWQLPTIVMAQSAGTQTPTTPITMEEAEAAQVVCKKHVKPHINAKGESLFYEEGFRHCGVISQYVAKHRDLEEMQASGAAAEEKTDPEKQMTRDLARRINSGAPK